MQEETTAESYPTGVPTSVIAISDTKVNKRQEGTFSIQHPKLSAFWDFIATWGGNLMWNDIDAGQHDKNDMK